MLTLAAALLCMEESLNRFESTSNEREMTVKMLHVLGKPEWNSEYRSSGRVLFGVSGSQSHGKTHLKLSAPLSSVCGRCYYFSNALAEVAGVK
jgi:hypothetical protein